MADANIPDELLHNIFARLPGKSLVRFRCVSNHWNRLISDPYLAKLLSRPMILLQFQHLYTMENNLSEHHMAQSMVKIPSRFQNIDIEYVTVVGTFNGIVLLVIEDTSLCTHMVLYNPFTKEYNKVPHPPRVRPRSCDMCLTYDPGFKIGFGETSDDFKIVIFFEVEECLYVPEQYSCYVFSVKNSSWSKPKYFTLNIKFFNEVGMFLNGLLYWTIDSNNTWMILALDIKKMQIMTINIPNGCNFDRHSNLAEYHQWSYNQAILGELHGCLCMINKQFRYNDVLFDLWVMKEQGVGNSWSVACSFKLPIGGFLSISVLDNRRILFTDRCNEVIIYDTSNDTIKTFSFPDIPESRVYGIEYVQTLFHLQTCVLFKILFG